MEENKFGERFKKLRTRNKLTQKVVAKELGIGQSAITNYEQGTRFPDEKTLKKITEYFSTSLDYLLDIKIVPKIQCKEINTDIVLEQYKNLIITNEFPKALDLILQIQKQGVPIEKLYVEILIPLLKHIGQLWESSIIDVAKEHLISEEIEKTVDILSFKTQINKRIDIRCVCATAGSELHRIPIKMISELLKSRGFKTWFLGNNTPTADILSFCKEHKVDMLILSATMDSSLDSVNNIISGMRLDKKLDNCKVIVGGSAFNRNPKAWKLVNADLMAKSISETIKKIENFSNKLEL